MNSKHFLGLSGLAIGFATAISAAPASAVTIAPGSQLSFSGDLLNTSGTIDSTTLGNTFQGTLTRTGSAIVSTATGTFADIFTGIAPTPLTAIGAKFVTSNPVSFKQVGLSATVPDGIDYVPTTDLVFTFANTSGSSTAPLGGTLTLFKDTRFLVTQAPSTGAVAGSIFRIYNVPRFDGIFTNGTNSTTVNFTSFSFEVDNIDNTNPMLNVSPSGSFSVVATVPSTPVPEPFTIIGTILGGSAAMRMRKKLTAAANN